MHVEPVINPRPLASEPSNSLSRANINLAMRDEHARLLWRGQARERIEKCLEPLGPLPYNSLLQLNVGWLLPCSEIQTNSSHGPMP